MKKLLSVVLAICILASVTMLASANEAKNPFTDVKESAWYYSQIVKAADLGLINGKTATEFKPDDLLTYAEAIKLAACMNELYTTGKVTLVNGTPWYQTYLDYCTEHKIISKTYNYGDNATRAGYMEIFANALPDEAFKDINNIPDGSILDVDGQAPYAIYVYKLYKAGIVTGVDELHNCNPDAFIKRSEVATILCRMMDEAQRVSFKMAEDEPVVVPPEDPEITTEIPVQDAEHTEVLPTKPVEIDKPAIQAPLTIHKQPEGAELDSYGVKHELEVQVFGGKAPYTYEWYYKARRDNVTIENGDYVKDADTAALVLSVEKENTLLGATIYCKITDSEGDTVTTEGVKVYGPFSMPVEQSLNSDGENVLTGRVEDGVLRAGDKVSVIRNGKVVAIGVAEDLQMFNKSLDEILKGDNAGIFFAKEDGVRPSNGDIVVKYREGDVVDTSDIVN